MSKLPKNLVKLYFIDKFVYIEQDTKLSLKRKKIINNQSLLLIK